MPAKPSGKIKTLTVRQTQKNGDIYIIERQIMYDPVKKYNKVLSSKLLSKIPKGEKDPVPTRPKRNKNNKSKQNMEMISACRNHIGMMDIIDHIGKVSGIDDAVYSSTDKGTAQKIISIARYFLATNGQSLPGIQTWQFNHSLPYEEGITEDIYHNLFVNVGLDESLQQNFFRKRCELLSSKDALAYDSTSISVYSENQNEARYGFNKAKDGLKTIKLLTLYSIDKRQPIAFTKQPGNLPDVTAVTYAIDQLTTLGVNTTEIVTDNGYYSENPLSELLQAGFDFITLVKTNIRWIRPEIDKQKEALNNFDTLCPFDHATHGVTVKLKHDFKKTRKYTNHKTGEKKGDEEVFSHRIYVHVYFNQSKKYADKRALEDDLYELKTLLERGTPIDEFSHSAQEKASKYFRLKKRGDKIIVVANNEAISDANKYHGYFVLISNKEKDPFECLSKYRKRETIESFFKAGKQHSDGTRARVWYADTLRGRMFVQFVSLCYYEHFSEEIRKLKSLLDEEISNGELTSNELKITKKLNTWVKNTPLYLQLQWFDAIEQIQISSKLRNRRWNTETTACDDLYLKKIGVKLS